MMGLAFPVHAGRSFPVQGSLLVGAEAQVSSTGTSEPTWGLY